MNKIEAFVLKAKEVHGDTYDYTECYIKGREVHDVICHVHGKFKQGHLAHIKGCGCARCSGKYKTTEDIIREFVSVHGNTYIYNKVVYVAMKKHVVVTCNVHGDFPVTPDNHVRGRGCPLCGSIRTGEKRMFDEEEVYSKIKKVTKNRVSFYPGEYNGMNREIRVHCNIHDLDYITIPNNLILGRGFCTKCRSDNDVKRLKALREFELKSKKLYGDKFTYSSVIYETAIKPVILSCTFDNHGEFPVTPHYHLNSSGTGGCPKCIESSGEVSIRRILQKFNISFETQKRFMDCKNKRPLPFDFYLPIINSCIEYDGHFHFSVRNKWGDAAILSETQRRDAIKTKYYADNGIPLLRIAYFENVEQKLTDFLKQHGVI